jgi:hypothetical protein
MVDLIQNFGFPIAIASMLIFVMYRLLSQYSNHIISQSNKFLQLVDSSVTGYQQGDKQLYNQLMDIKSELQKQSSILAIQDKKLSNAIKMAKDSQNFLKKTTDFEPTNID